jgi:hypothetical protein
MDLELNVVILLKRANVCEKLVESEIEHCAIVVDEEDLKNKINGMRRVVTSQILFNR